MPELPEVETVARQLAPQLSGAKLNRLSIIDKKLKVPGGRSLAGATIKGVYRLGKQIVIELDTTHKVDAKRYLACHLRMTGRLIYTPGKAQRDPSAKHVRAVLTCEHGCVSFIDPRRFGTLIIVKDRAQIEPPGVDPTGSSFTLKCLANLIAGSKTPIKPWLLNQDKITGIGNVYASEICHGARLHPAREACSLTKDELTQLHRATKRILKAAIKHCGTTFSDFQDSTGSPGGYVKYLKVYGRRGERCTTCGTPIARISQAGRGTFYCPGCQCQ